MKFLQTDIEKLKKKMSDKRKYKKDSLTGKNRKPWNRETN